MTISATLEPKQWIVKRHGGRVRDTWRRVFEGDEAGARDAFAYWAKVMRQGGVELVDAMNTLVDCRWAPRVRSRW